MPPPPPPPTADERHRQGAKGPPPTHPPPPHRPGGGRGGGPPSPPPPRTHHSRGATGAALRPPGPGGRPPLRGNGGAMRATAAGPAPANPHRRAGATRTTEQEGGRAPHDPPVTTACSEVTEGGYQVRWGIGPGGAVHGPPLTPPNPGAALQPRPQARAGRERTGDTERARKEYHRPPPGTRAGRPRRDTPPPPRPPTGPPAAGAPAPTPRGRRDGPPRPRGEPECDPPPRPSRRLQWGPRRASGPTPAHRDAAQIVPREAGWARTGMVWVATPPMDSTTPRDARFVAYPGKAAPQPANH